jgi:peptidoglycan/LPS O-acetylase OafA/YrhL
VRADLEGLRAIAVVGVVVYHLRATWLPGGFAGVDVFFVLSGFFITGLLLREARTTGRVDLRAFWGRRARRLLPASVLVLVVTVLSSLVVADVLDAQRFARQGVYAAVFALNWRLADQGTSYFADPDPSPLVHYWSLGVEEQFYAVWPLALLALVLLCRGRPRARGVAVSAVIAVAVIASFAVCLHQTSSLQPYAYFATYSRAWQLGLGAALATAAPVLGRAPSALRLFARWVGVAAVVGFYLAAPHDVVYPGWASLVPTLGAVLVVAAGLPQRDRADRATRDPVLRLLGSRPAQAGGRYSYGWYLWHWPPLVLLPLAIGHPLSNRSLIGCAVLTLGLAVLSFHVLEQPIRSSRVLAARRGRGSRTLGVVLIAAAVVSCGMSAVIAGRQASTIRIRNDAGVVLSPQPATAASELPQPSKDGCEVGLSSSTLSADCRYLPDTGHGDVVLTGDSHAVQWYPAVDRIARQRHLGLRVWARASCPFADVTKVGTGGPSTACDTWRADITRRLVAAHPDLVVVSSYASVVPSLYDRSTGRLVGGAASRRLYQDGMQRQLARLRAAGIRVLLIRDNPTFDVSGPKCVLGHDRHVSACSVTRRHGLRSAADLRAAQAVPGTHWIDLTGAFCDAHRCHQVVGSTLAYRDSNHLTIEMVDRLQAKIAGAADAAMSATS